jgi:uncharacterized damage-inducible protein DinB
MIANLLEKLFEHNNWANYQMIQACLSLSDEQLDAQPQSATKGSIRQTLVHLVKAQRNYLRLLTLPLEERRESPPLEFADLQESAFLSGEGLLALARDWFSRPPNARLQTADGYLVEPWVVMVQAINHATEHREQINSMLTALGITPLDQDGWTFGEAANAITPVST